MRESLWPVLGRKLFKDLIHLRRTGELPQHTLWPLRGKNLLAVKRKDVGTDIVGYGVGCQGLHLVYGKSISCRSGRSGAWASGDKRNQVVVTTGQNRPSTWVRTSLHLAEAEVDVVEVLLELQELDRLIGLDVSSTALPHGIRHAQR